MMQNLGHSIKSAFFSSLEQAGCVNLDTMNPSSSDEEDEPDARKGRSRSRIVGCIGPKGRLKSERFHVEKFHHVEFWCGDAKNTSLRFSWGLGMQQVAKSDQSTGNQVYCSYVLESHDLKLVFSAPYSSAIDQKASRTPNPHLQPSAAREFFQVHGLAVRAVAVQVSDVSEAFSKSVAFGAEPVSRPTVVADDRLGGKAAMAEVKLYGDVVLRFITLQNYSGPFLPLYEAVPDANQVLPFGIARLDCVMGSVPRLMEAVQHLARFTGFHEHAEHAAEDSSSAAVAAAATSSSPPSSPSPSPDCHISSMVLANDDETVLLALNEPPPPKPPRLTAEASRIGGGPAGGAVSGAGGGAKGAAAAGGEAAAGAAGATTAAARSQVRTYLDQNGGPGVQLLSLASNDIFGTVREMRARAEIGGFEFVARPTERYYDELPRRVGGDRHLSPKQLQACRQLGVLADRDEQGILLQIFTKPLGDRMTIFVQITQRILCAEADKDGHSYQMGSCGGCRKGIFSELFKSMEDYERIHSNERTGGQGCLM